MPSRPSGTGSATVSGQCRTISYYLYFACSRNAKANLTSLHSLRYLHCVRASLLRLSRVVSPRARRVPGMRWADERSASGESGDDGRRGRARRALGFCLCACILRLDNSQHRTTAATPYVPYLYLLLPRPSVRLRRSSGGEPSREPPCEPAAARRVPVPVPRPDPR